MRRHLTPARFDPSGVFRPLRRVTPGCDRGLFTFKPSGLFLRWDCASSTGVLAGKKAGKETARFIVFRFTFAVSFPISFT